MITVHCKIAMGLELLFLVKGGKRRWVEGSKEGRYHWLGFFIYSDNILGASGH